MKFFHATENEITNIAATRDICLATCPEEAQPYAPEGTVYEIAADDMAIANEDDIRAAAEIFDWYDPTYWVFELVDEEEVREELAARGFDACEYADMGPNNAYEHQTVRVWETDKLEIV